MYTRLATAAKESTLRHCAPPCQCRARRPARPAGSQWTIRPGRSQEQVEHMGDFDVWTILNPCLWTIERTIFLKVRILRKSPTLPGTCPWHPATCWISKPKPAKNYQVNRLNRMMFSKTTKTCNLERPSSYTRWHCTWTTTWERRCRDAERKSCQEKRW